MLDLTRGFLPSADFLGGHLNGLFSQGSVLTISFAVRNLTLNLGLDGLLLGLCVAADPLLVQAHGDCQRVVNWAESYARGRTEVGREAEQILVRVTIPKRDYSTLTTRSKEGGLKLHFMLNKTF